MTQGSLTRLATPGAALFLALAPIPFLGDLRPRAALLIALWLTAHAAYLLAAWSALRPSAAPGGVSPPGGPAAATSRRRLLIVLAVGLAARGLLLPSAPTLSEDAYRYLWDGRLVASGVNPFPHAPSDPALSPFHDDLLSRLNHADVPTIYPPVAQFLFAAATMMAPTPLAWKLVLLMVEGILLLALAALLRRRGLPPERLLLYYWSPVAIVESFGSGHVDLAMAAFLAAALALEESGRRAAAGVALALSVGTKYVPVLLVPFWLARRRYLPLAVAAAVTALLFLPFADAGRALWTGLVTYSRHWEWNGLFYPVLRAAGLSGDACRAALAAALAAVSVAAAWRARTSSGAVITCLAAFVLLSPTVYPWYLVPVAALLPLHPDPGLLLFTGLVPLSYAALPAFAASGEWRLPAWVPWVEYGGLAIVWTAAALRRRAGTAHPRQRRAAACRTESPPT